MNENIETKARNAIGEIKSILQKYELKMDTAGGYELYFKDDHGIIYWEYLEDMPN